MTRVQRTFVFFLVGAMLVGNSPLAFGQLKFLKWLRERAGETTAEDAAKAKQDANWQKEHFASAKAQETFAAAIKKTRCTTCHPKKGTKKVRNPFGMRLSKTLESKLKMDSKAISAALKTSAPPEMEAKVQKAFYESLDTVLEMPIDPEEKESGTFGQRVKNGELPVSS